MTKQEIKWASQHDWFSHSNGDVVYVIEHVADVTKPGELNWVETTKAFNDLEKLRNWAGY